MSDPDIEAAIAGVKAGKIEAYTIVVQAYHRRLRAWVSQYCPPGIDPDEIAHRVFIEAYRQIDRYEIGTQFFSWLSAFARNFLKAEYKRILRQERNQTNYLEHLAATEMEAALLQSNGPAEDRIAALRECQRRLSDPCQAVLALRYAEGASLDTIAGRIGKSVAAVKFQLFAIRRSLRECIQRRLIRSAANS